MSDPFLGEIKMVAFNFAPYGWAFCNGQLLSIAQNTAVFSLLGTTYGGDGRTTFGLPNFQGRAPMQPRTGPGLTPRAPGETGGSATVTLLSTQIPSHTHSAMAASDGTSVSPTNTAWGTGMGRTPPPLYQDANPDVVMSASALSTSGSSMSHNNMQPYLAVNFVIALQGIYPARP